MHASLVFFFFPSMVVFTARHSSRACATSHAFHKIVCVLMLTIGGRDWISFDHIYMRIFPNSVHQWMASDLYCQIRRIKYNIRLPHNINRILRCSIFMSCFLCWLIYHILLKIFDAPRLSSPQSTRLYPNDPLTINLRPFPVCHPRELDLDNLTLKYHQVYTKQQRDVCFLVEHIDGGPWWSYVTHEFAEILTHLKEFGLQAGIKYRPFPLQHHFEPRTNLTKLFLNSCDMDENLPIEKQAPIIALVWDINQRTWQHLRRQVADLLRNTRIRLLVFIDDLHFTTKGCRLSRSYLFDSIASEIFSTYPYIFHNYYKNISSAKITWLPHSASTLSYNTINETANDVLFVSGANLFEWYPCRSRAFLLCYTRKDLAACLEHPGYGETMKNDSTYFYGGRRYFSYMRQFTFGLATCQSVHYAIAKLFELPANGVALITTPDLVEILKSLHLFPNEHFLTIGCSSSKSLPNEIARIQNISKEIIFKMRVNSQKIIHERHLTTHRAALIHTRLLSQALIASSTSDIERLQLEQWGRSCFSL